jgi:tetratricopeptide (TPR) repeat protein
MISIIDAIPQWFLGSFGFILVANTVVSIILVVLISFFLSQFFSKRKTIFMLLPFCLTVPVVAPIFSVFYAVFLYVMAMTSRKADFFYKAYPDFSNQKDAKLTQHGEGGVAARLTSKTFSERAKLQSLVSLNNQASVAINKINESMLQEEGDELRLYAYGMLSKQENKLYRDIHELEEKAKATKNTKNLFICYKAISYKFWDLIYLNLAHDDIRKFALEKTEHYIKEGFGIKENDLALLILMGRLRLMQKNYEEATKYFELALTMNAPHSKVIPYLAEMAFINRDYAQVKAYYSLTNNLRFMPVMGGSAKFWSGKE